MSRWSVFVLTMVPLLLVAGCGGRSSLPGALTPAGDARPPDAALPTPDRALPTPDRALPRPDADPTAKDRIVRACTVALACLAGVQGNWAQTSVSNCVEWFARRPWPWPGMYLTTDEAVLDRILRCAKDAGSCATFVSCYGGTWLGPNLCREGGVCQGNTLMTHQNNALYLSCGAHDNATCADLPTGLQRACCARATCAGTMQVSCQGGGKGTLCSLGIAHSFDCAPSGRVCTTAATGEICRGTGASCKPDAPVTCQGSAASYCAAGRLATVDCAKNPLMSRCLAGLHAAPYPCVAAGNACHANYPGACSGTDLQVCVDGTLERVSCTALGFKRCRAGSPSLGQFATCGN